MTRIIITLVMLFSVRDAALTHPGEEQEIFKAWVEIIDTAPGITFIGKFLNTSKDDVRLSYRLKTEKNGSSGRTLSNQAGPFLARSRHEVLLSKMVINIQPNDSCTTTLQIMNGETIVASDSIQYHGDSVEGR